MGMLWETFLNVIVIFCGKIKMLKNEKIVLVANVVNCFLDRISR